MNNLKKASILTAALLVLSTSTVMLQAQSDPHSAMPHGDMGELKQQLTKMQIQLESIEAALSVNHSGATTQDASMAMKGTSMGDRGMMMGGSSSADMDMNNASGTDLKMDGKGMRGDMKKMDKMKMDRGKKPMGMMGGGMSMGEIGIKKGMSMMGSMAGMGDTMSMVSALPGFPGISHIYHIGATGHFLNHGDHLKLNPEQQKQLGEFKQASDLKQATYQREIDAFEQELWELTAADAPDIAKIEAKVKSIAKKLTDKRIDFIRSVGEAAKVLTDTQRKTLAGETPETSTDPVDHSSH